MDEKRTYRTYTAAEVVAMWDSGAFALWKSNREISEKRVLRIAEDVTKAGDFGPVPIVLGVIRGVSYVVDGQHRLRAAKLLTQPTAGRATLCLCREACRDEDELLTLFRNVNCGTPVPPSHWNSDVKTFAEELTVAIKQHWGANVFSKASTTYRPRITEAHLYLVIDNCRETREAAAIHCLSVPNALALIIRMNDAAELMFGGGGKAAALAQCEVSTKMYETAVKLRFFVGLRKRWLENFISQLAEEWVLAGAGN